MHATEGVNLNGTPPDLNQRDQSLNLNLEPSYYIRYDASPHVSTSGILYVYAVLFKICVKITSDFRKLRENHRRTQHHQRSLSKNPQVSAWVWVRWLMWVGVDTRISVLSDQRAFG